EGAYSFELMVTDTGGLIHKDTVTLTVAATISPAWPVLPPPICPQPYRIVILGSSTGVGAGALPVDSSWANKLRMYVQQQNAQVVVTNLSLGGYTTYHVNPTGYIPGPYRPYPDPARNITAALALNPDAIIINLPTNDAAGAFTLQETQNNFNLIDATAAAQHVPVWVTTSQPRSGLSAGAQSNLVQLKDWVNQRFGNKAIDFWTIIANPDGTVNPTYSAGDGVHINNLGHHLVFTRVLNEKIWDSICIRRNPINLPPVANAGANIVIHAPVDSAFLNGSLSNDADGSIIIYKWKKVAGPTATIINENNVNTWAKSLVAGNYLFELTVTDNLLAVDKDTVAVLLNIPPTANAGNDSSITLPGNSILLSVIASDADGSITSYSWRQYSGVLVGNIAYANTSQASITFISQGNYGFEITVTDNNGATDKDSVLVIVYPDPTITWSGAVSTVWENPANWVGNIVPFSTNNVVIPAGLSRYPVISVNTTVRSIDCATGTSVTVATGVLLIVMSTTQ
ncbi:MAG TPA: PKD domain-containing protein, partial [Ferruginibacter sp.]|nr:PKD domain-containing protein [Ferruginibacter sp.]